MGTESQDAHGFVRQEGWEDLDLLFNIGTGRTMFSKGTEQDARLRMRFYKRTVDNYLVGQVRFGQGSDGPPGHAHGGVCAYVLDEAMGTAAWMNQYPVVAAELRFRYRQLTPLDVNLTVEAWLVKESARRVTVYGRLLLPGGVVAVEGEGEFAVLSKAKIMSLLPIDKFTPQQKISWQNNLQSHSLKWLKDDAG